jgi:hypothetical protein
MIVWRVEHHLLPLLAISIKMLTYVPERMILVFFIREDLHPSSLTDPITIAVRFCHLHTFPIENLTDLYHGASWNTLTNSLQKFHIAYGHVLNHPRLAT